MDTVTDANNPQMIESRMGLYRLFRRLFETEVDAEFLNFVKDNDLVEINDWIKQDKEELALNEDEKLLTELAAEYVYLFVGPGQHLPPYESVYTTKEGLLNGQPATDVKKFILAAGFEFDGNNRRYSDHICNELEFMERLLAHQLTAVNENNQEEVDKSYMLQQEFFRLHLIAWLPEFCSKIKEKGNLTFYKQLADAMLEFLRDEGKRLFVATQF